MWSTVLKINARKEFEQAKYEQDPEIIARLLFVGRTCLNQTTEKFAQAVQQLQNKVDSTKQQ